MYGLAVLLVDTFQDASRRPERLVLNSSGEDFHDAKTVFRRICEVRLWTVSYSFCLLDSYTEQPTDEISTLTFLAVTQLAIYSTSTITFSYCI